MKRSLLLSFLLLLFAGSAFSQQAGVIVVSPDAEGCGCEVVDTGGLVQLHFLHKFHSGATASQWKLDLGGLPWVHLGDQIAFSTVIGTTISGISIGYGACMPHPTYLGLANFFGSNAAGCPQIGIVADPASLSGQIEAVDCATPANKTFPGGNSIVVNCECLGSPVESTTWGGIKTLYR
jgi:hypothetical protein